MKIIVAGCVAIIAVVAGALIFFAAGHAADSGNTGLPAASPDEAAGRLVVHEWGTFTSFSGSDGVPLHFVPNNADLPNFVHAPKAPLFSKTERLAHSGTVSMETPVIYFYTDRATRASVRVDFPLGWITEWYPVAASAPVNTAAPANAEGKSMRWDVKLLVGESPRLPQTEGDNHYYRARETDAVSLQTEGVAADKALDPALPAGKVVQQEKFLFYRGVGTFPTPVTVRALGEGKVRVKNVIPGRVGGVVLVTVRSGALGFQVLGDLEAGSETTATLPEPNAKRETLAEAMIQQLTAAGLYEKEARAMVKTWDSAWFGEDGTRVLYLVPRTQTDELLPLTVAPKPTEVVRVLVGRHDFLTPEQESAAEQQVKRLRAAQAELESARKELQKIGRFADQARQQAEKRLKERSGQK